MREIVKGCFTTERAVGDPCEPDGRPLDPVARSWWDAGFRVCGYTAPPWGRLHHAYMKIRKRLWAKVDIPVDLDDCWIWQGALSHKRRGQRRPILRVGDKVKHVARVVCEWVNGPPPTPKHQAGHTCPGGENELCVSPRHLVWMTPLENQSVKRGKFKPRSAFRDNGSTAESPLTSLPYRGSSRMPSGPAIVS